MLDSLQMPELRESTVEEFNPAIRKSLIGQGGLFLGVLPGIN
jgi:hypothetical protein